MTQLQIELDGVDKHYGAYHALKGIDLAIPKGTFVALVGPSGCGKSTLLRTIAGLEKVSGGALRIAGANMTGTPPRKRDLAMVFQSYALYPHKTVRQNLTYSLRLKGIPRAEADRKAEEVARITGLEALLERYPRELSGGQRQRVAMGRAIVRNPKAFLFDEPLSNLDAALRVQMRAEVRRLHDRLGATSVYVTHDQVEAMTMADHVVVLRAGRIEQQGAPMELYDRPANQFVAGFIGSPATNFVPGRVTADGHAVHLDLPGAPCLAISGATPGRPVTAGLRPEHLQPCDPGTPGALALPVAVVEATGSQSFLVTDTDPALTICLAGRSPVPPGGTLSVTIDPGQVMLFDADSGDALRP
ncbi:ABC transporter ATP-binding protein [Poseidonocella sp. HB161398]|uniref:ABC transporter ATP-binding protein n=1 Tax=Poseidonocella sp. HB161398 TaxID=2320855 RepID=UPI001108AFA7|nr:ABC transporter ATP-binding protein [Poseidonocella sp. HB161398]